MIQEYLHTTISRSVIPVETKPNEQEIIEASKTYLASAIEALKFLREGKLSAFPASKSYPNNPNISLIALLLFEREKKTQFQQVNELSSILERYLIEISEIDPTDKTTTYTNKRAVNHFLSQYLPPLNLSVDLKILILSFTLHNMEAFEFPKKMKKEIENLLTKRLHRENYNFVKEIFDQLEKQKLASSSERVLIHPTNVRKINGLRCTPCLLDLKLALKKAALEDIPIALKINDSKLMHFQTNEQKKYQSVQMESLNPGLKVLEIHISSTMQNLGQPLEILLLSSSASDQHYPSADSSKPKIPLFFESPGKEWLTQIVRFKRASNGNSFEQLSETYIKQVSGAKRDEWKQLSKGKIELQDLAEAFIEFKILNKQTGEKTQLLSFSV